MHFWNQSYTTLSMATPNSEENVRHLKEKNPAEVSFQFLKTGMSWGL